MTRGRPLSDRLPEVLAIYAEDNDLSMRSLGLSLGKSENWINKIFNGDQAQLQPYINVVDFAGISLDDFVAIVVTRNTSELIETMRLKLAKARNVPVADISLLSLSQEIKVSDGFLRELQKNTGKLKVLNSYFLIAKTIGCKIDDLRCGTKSLSKIAS